MERQLRRVGLSHKLGEEMEEGGQPAKTAHNRNALGILGHAGLHDADGGDYKGNVLGISVRHHPAERCDNARVGQLDGALNACMHVCVCVCVRVYVFCLVFLGLQERGDNHLGC